MKKFLFLLFFCSMSAFAQNEKVVFDMLQGPDNEISILYIQEIQFVGEGQHKSQVKVIMNNGTDPVLFEIKDIAKITCLPPNLNIPIRLYSDGETTPDMVLTSTFDFIAFNEKLSVDEIYSAGDLAFTGNFPNPFSDATTISFELKTTGNIRAQIVDMQGNSIAELANADFGAGIHSLVWNGRDISGKLVADGMYFCRIQSGFSVIQQKLIIVK